MTSSNLKIIAVVSMLLSHIAIMFSAIYSHWIIINAPHISKELLLFTTIFDGLGRIAFPIYAFCIAEGCRKTKNIKKYMMRLLVFALVSQIPYNVALSSQNFNRLLNEVKFFVPEDLNIFFTLLLGVIAIYLFQLLHKIGLQKWVCFFPLIICMILAEVSGTDYGFFGVGLIFTFYVCTSRKSLFIFAQIILFCLYMVYAEWTGVGYKISWISHVVNGHWNLVFNCFLKYLLCTVSPFFIIKYNGKKGKNLTWLFYFSYPLHLLILIAIRELIMRN